jgi:hypothetical protein
MRRRITSLAALALAFAALAVPPSRAAKNTTRGDLLWQSTALDSLDLRSIAFLPAATFDNGLEARRQVEASMGQALRGTGYRWASPLVTRDQLVREGGEPLLKALTQGVLKTGRLDSLDAPSVSRITRTRAMLTVRVDRFERLELPFDQSGKPSTTVALTAALVDSTGRLLWTVSGSETAEGPYQDASAGTLGIKASGLNNQPMTNQGGAPTYAETLNRLLARWVPRFPARAAAPATPSN